MKKTLLLTLCFCVVAYTQENMDQYNALMKKAKQFVKKDRYKEAQALFMQALNFTRGKDKEFANTCINLAKAFEITESRPYKKTLFYYHEAIAAYKRIKTMQINQANALYSCASLYYICNQNKKAISYYEETLKIRQQVLKAPHQDIVLCLKEIGSLCYFESNYKRAIEVFSKAAKQIKKFNESQLEEIEGHENFYNG